MTTPSERLLREADDIRALAEEHGQHRDYALVELMLRLLAMALDEDSTDPIEGRAA